MRLPLPMPAMARQPNFRRWLSRSDEMVDCSGLRCLSVECLTRARWRLAEYAFSHSQAPPSDMAPAGVDHHFIKPSSRFRLRLLLRRYHDNDRHAMPLKHAPAPRVRLISLMMRREFTMISAGVAEDCRASRGSASNYFAFKFMSARALLRAKSPSISPRSRCSAGFRATRILLAFIISNMAHEILLLAR